MDAEDFQALANSPEADEGRLVLARGLAESVVELKDAIGAEYESFDAYAADEEVFDATKAEEQWFDWELIRAALRLENDLFDADIPAQLQPPVYSSVDAAMLVVHLTVSDDQLALEWANQGWRERLKDPEAMAMVLRSVAAFYMMRVAALKTEDSAGAAPLISLFLSAIEVHTQTHDEMAELVEAWRPLLIYSGDPQFDEPAADAANIFVMGRLRDMIEQDRGGGELAAGKQHLWRDRVFPYVVAGETQAIQSEQAWVQRAPQLETEPQENLDGQ